MSFLNRILACVDKVIPTLKNDSAKHWKRMTEEGKAEELEKVSERPKEATGSAEVPESKQTPNHGDAMN
jgi:hypothetical protein